MQTLSEKVLIKYKISKLNNKLNGKLFIELILLFSNFIENYIFKNFIHYSFLTRAIHRPGDNFIRIKVY